MRSLLLATAALLLLFAPLAGCDDGSLLVEEEEEEVVEVSDDPWREAGPSAGYVMALHLPGDGRAFALAAPDSSQSSIHLYERSSADAPWQKAFEGGAYFIYAGPSGRVYAGRGIGGLRWRTTGGTWRNEADAFRTPTGCDFLSSGFALVFDVIEYQGQTLAAAHCGLFTAVDRFERVGFPGGRVTRLAEVGGALLAIVGGELFRSEGTLETWTRLDTFGGVARALITPAGDASVLYLRHDDELWRTYDGQAWEQTGALPPSVREDSYVALAPGGTLYATGARSTGIADPATAFLASTDGGASWNEVDAPQENYNVVAADDDGWLAASKASGLYCGAPGEETQVCSEGLPTSIEAMATASGRLVAYGSSGAVFGAAAGGAWELLGVQRGEDLYQFGDRLAVPREGGLATSPDGTAWTDSSLPFTWRSGVYGADAVAYAVDARGDLWRSPDEGASWAQADEPGTVRLITRGLDDVLYVLTESGVFYRGEGGTRGDRWTEVFAPLPERITPYSDVAFAVAEDGTAFYHRGGVSYQWAGKTWREIPEDLSTLAPDAATKRLFAVGERVTEWRGSAWADFGPTPQPVRGVTPWEGRLYAFGESGVYVRSGS
jgi:hypothetical protein